MHEVQELGNSEDVIDVIMDYINVLTIFDIKDEKQSIVLSGALSANRYSWVIKVMLLPNFKCNLWLIHCHAAYGVMQNSDRPRAENIDFTVEYSFNYQSIGIGGGNELEKAFNRIKTELSLTQIGQFPVEIFENALHSDNHIGKCQQYENYQSGGIDWTARVERL